MDLLERALALAASPLFAELAPAVLIRLAERARATELAAGERRTTDDTVWIVAEGSLVVASHGAGMAMATESTVRRHGGTATPGHVLGLVRVVAPATPLLEVVAERPSIVVGLSVDDVRDVLDEDPAALAALADALSRVLLEAT
jgi:CRP-like cAMP-binding protein